MDIYTFYILRVIKHLNFFTVVTILGFLFTARIAETRPEYALVNGINRCTACHVSPSGGGPRRLSGKYFGSNTFESSPFSHQDWVGLEFKSLLYYPEKPVETRNGMGTMAGSIWANLPIKEMKPDEWGTYVVLEHNLSGFGGSARHGYLQWVHGVETENYLLPQHIMIGRFYPPFGLTTDEHRTYTKMQINAQWNVGYETGMLFSSNPVEPIHYDISIVNGVKNLGSAPDTGVATTWGGVFNIRWMPHFAPMLLGVSASHHARVDQAKSPQAQAAYFMLSFHRMTKNKFPVTLFGEYTLASDWNIKNTALDSFVSNSNYLTSVSLNKSQGSWFQINYDVGTRWTFTYKLDQLSLDKNFPADAYIRHGLGFKHIIGPNLWIMMRAEKAEPGHPDEKEGSKIGALDATWFLININI